MFKSLKKRQELESATPEEPADSEAGAENQKAISSRTGGLSGGAPEHERQLSSCTAELDKQKYAVHPHPQYNSHLVPKYEHKTQTTHRERGLQTTNAISTAVLQQ